MDRNRNAKAKQGHVIGRKAFAKISVVEGIRLTAEMEADFRGFDKKRLSPSERRRILIAKYGKAG